MMVLGYVNLLIRKKNFLVFLLSFLLLFPSFSFAFDEPCQESLPEIVESDVHRENSFSLKSNNVFYDVLNDHEYLFAPFSGVVMGAFLCGPWCALSVGGLGAIDEVAVRFGYADKHYFTWVSVGLAVGNTVQTSLPMKLAGAGVMAIVFFMPETLTSYDELIIPTITTLTGGLAMGYPGGLIGGSAGLIDELLIEKDVIDRHYLGFSVVGASGVHLLGLFNPAVSGAVGVVLGLVASNYEENIVSTISAPIQTCKNLYGVYIKFIPEDQLKLHIENQALTLVATQFILQHLILKTIGYQQNVRYNFERLDGDEAWSNFRSGFVSFAVFLVPYVVGQSASNVVDRYFSKKLQFLVEDKIRDELFSGEIPLRLASDKNSTVSIDNLRADSYLVTTSGTELVTSGFSSVVKGAHGIGMVVLNSPNIFVYSFLYNQMQVYFLGYVADKQQVYDKEIKGLESKRLSIMKHDVENIKTIIERGGMDFTARKLRKVESEVRELAVTRELLDSIIGVGRSMLGLTDYMINYYLVGNEIKNGRLSFDKRDKAQMASWQVSSMLSWPAHSAEKVVLIDASLERVGNLLDKIHAEPDDKDQIVRIMEEGESLVLSGIEVGVEDRVLVATESLKLDMGKAYAITGESGCGKTSFLSKIKGIKENGILGKGNISYSLVNGREPKIVMITQRDYFPIESSLLEMISYPDYSPDDEILKNEYKDKVSALLEAIGLSQIFDVKNEAEDIDDGDKLEIEEADVLEDIKSWQDILSGGEKKKLLMISALIKNPDILILDEVFNGLDKDSIIRAQSMLKKYLPNTLIMIVDHHAQDNNYDGFYSQELNFSNKSINVMEIGAKNF